MLKSISPKFIKRLDAFLLEHYPVIWMSKIHYALWHGGVLALLAILLGLVMPFDLERSTAFGLWHFLFTVISVVVLCVWIYHYVIFNKDKHFGQAKPSDAYLNFGLLFTGLTLFLMIPWLFIAVLNERIANSYGTEEILSDIRILNENYPYVADNSNKYKLWTDTGTQQQFFNVKKVTYSDFFNPYFIDGLPKKNNRLPHETIDYQPITNEKQLTERIQLYLNTAGKYSPAYKLSAEHYVKNYLLFVNRNWTPVSSLDESDAYAARIVSEVIENVCRSKFHKLYFFEDGYFVTMFFFIFFLTTILSLFKLVFWRQYLLVAVIFIFYPIIAFIASQLIPYGSGFSRDSIFQAALILFFIVSLICMIRSSGAYFRPFVNIMSQGFYATVAYVPFFLVLMAYEHTDLFHNHDPYYDYYKEIGVSKQEYYLNRMLWDYWQDQYELWIKGSLYFGLSAFVLALPLFRALFVKQLALPKRA